MDDIDADRKRSGTGSDEEGKGVSGPHRPHRCSIPACGKEFKLKAHLSRHYASAHGVDLRGNAGPGGVPGNIGVNIALGKIMDISLIPSHFLAPTKESTVPTIQKRSSKCKMQAILSCFGSMKDETIISNWKNDIILLY